jgi:hypothetical protein
MNKQLEIFQNTIHTANNVSDALKQMPKTGKRGRNIFLKSYNRRPMNKKKRAQAMFNVAWHVYFGAIQNAIIISTPMLKYPKGGGDAVS